MILDKQSLVSDDQAITATAISTNVIDLGAAGTPKHAAAALNNDKGLGVPVPFLVQVTTAFDNLTSLTVTLENSANSDLSSAVVLATETIVLADLIAGKQMHMQVLPKDVTRRYLGMRYTVTGAAPTAGAITAGVTMGNQSNVTGA